MSIGTALAEARARAGLSLDEVADQTRIRRTLIENIEHDDFHACGGDFYARGHIRSIAHVLGVDAEPLVEEFDRLHQPDTETPTATAVLAADHARDTTRPRPNWSAAMVVALALVLGFGGWAALNDDSAPSGATTSTGGVPTTAPAGTTDTSTGGSESDGFASAPATPSSTGGVIGDDAVAQAPDDEVVVTLSTNDGRSWISATGRNGRVLYEGILQPNREKTVRDSSKVFVVLGNAGAVSLTVNGQDLGVPGAPGEVQRLTFGPGDQDLSGG